MPEIAHADQNRNAEFRKLLGQWNVRIAVALPALFLGIGSGITEPVAGLIIFIVFLLIGLGVVFWIADSRAGKSFYEQYAAERGLVASDKPLGHQTELLRTGAGQNTIRRWDGELAPGIKGSLAHWSYALESEPGTSTQPQWVDYTIVTIPLIDLSTRLRELNVNRSKPSSKRMRKASEQASERLDDFTAKAGVDLTRRNTDLRRLTLESQALDDEYDIYVHKDQDPNFVRQLFSPSFIVWLTEASRPFQYGRGVLVTATGGHVSSATAFDNQISGACEIARRISAEAQEGE